MSQAFPLHQTGICAGCGAFPVKLTRVFPRTYFYCDACIAVGLDALARELDANTADPAKEPQP